MKSTKQQNEDTQKSQEALIAQYLMDGLHTDGAQHKQYALCKLACVLGMEYLLMDIEDRGMAN